MMNMFMNGMAFTTVILIIAMMAGVMRRRNEDLY